MSKKLLMSGLGRTMRRDMAIAIFAAQVSEPKNHRACRKCRGYCCRMFSMRNSKKGFAEIEARYRQALKDMQDAFSRREIIGWLRGEPRDNRVLRAKIVQHLDYVYTMVFAQKYFVRIPAPKDHTKPEWKEWFYTCKCFDPVNNCCEMHEQRPYPCQRYLCPAVDLHNRVPEASEMIAGKAGL